MCRYHFLEIIFLYMYCVFYIYMRKIVGTEGREIMEYVYMGPLCLRWCSCLIIITLSLRLQLYIRIYVINLFIGEESDKVGQIGSCAWCKSLWLRAPLFISHVPVFFFFFFLWPYFTFFFFFPLFFNSKPLIFLFYFSLKVFNF